MAQPSARRGAPRALAPGGSAAAAGRPLHPLCFTPATSSARC